MICGILLLKRWSLFQVRGQTGAQEVAASHYFNAVNADDRILQVLKIFMKFLFMCYREAMTLSIKAPGITTLNVTENMLR
jgi:hypothetical protein